MNNKETDFLYKSYIIDLFILPFPDIKNKYSNEIYSWNNFEKIFLFFYKKLLNNIDESNLIKYYYIFSFLYLNYTNYLKYISHNDFNNSNIYEIYNKIKTNESIITNLVKYSTNKNIKKVLYLSNLFISIKLKFINNYNELEKNELITNFINDNKQLEKISVMPNDNFKKILNLIIYRFISSQNNKYNNYHEFYINKISNKINNQFLNFNEFIKCIPNSKDILNFNLKVDNTNININLNKIIKFLLNKYSKFYINENSLDDKIIIFNKKFEGSINILINKSNENIEFNHYQGNLSLIHFNINELKEFNFLKKTNNYIEININSKNITDLSSLLHIIHLLTISFKIIENYPTDLYEYIYPLEYNNYYLLTFCNFLEFVKPDINTNYTYNKFIIDIIKYFYIYSYYDYYFYYKNNLINTIISNFKYKNNIFEEFINNLKNVLKLPKELLSFPPFFDYHNDDINSVIYYSFEIPSYFKLYDFINAICIIFNYNINKSSEINIIEIICKFIDFTNKNKILQKNNNNSKIILNKNSSTSSSNSVVNSIDSSNSSSISYSENEIESKLDTEILNIMTLNDKKLMHNNNTYIEINLDNNQYDCILNTEI